LEIFFITANAGVGAWVRCVSAAARQAHAGESAQQQAAQQHQHQHQQQHQQQQLQAQQLQAQQAAASACQLPVAVAQALLLGCAADLGCAATWLLGSGAEPGWTAALAGPSSGLPRWGTAAQRFERLLLLVRPVVATLARARDAALAADTWLGSSLQRRQHQQHQQQPGGEASAGAGSHASPSQLWCAAAGQLAAVASCAARHSARAAARAPNPQGVEPHESWKHGANLVTLALVIATLMAGCSSAADVASMMRPCMLGSVQSSSLPSTQQQRQLFDMLVTLLKLAQHERDNGKQRCRSCRRAGSCRASASWTV
jgi:hypothetical protein